MSSPGADFPERLRAAGGTDLERRLLEATAHEEPSPELRVRMAQAIGVSTVALGAVAGMKLTAGVTATKAGAGSSTFLPWISVGVLALAVTGAVVATRWGTRIAPAARHASPVVNTPTLSPVASTSAEIPPVATAESSTRADGAALVRRRPTVIAGDLRDQIVLVDAARAALATGTGDRALEILRRYQDKYPAGSFRPEAAALKVEALAKLGRNAEARALAERFVAEYGKVPLADRVARVAGIARP